MKPDAVDKLAVIIIIGYKPFLTDNEKASMRQCYKILNRYPIKVISPKGMDVSEYKKIIPGSQFEYVDKKWTSSYLMNSQFKTNRWLYNRYRDYDYLLFYELDCWVFRDELEDWCNKGWDYIGAPWFDRGTNKITGAGNGGFSLRKNSSSLQIADRIIFLKKLRKVWFKSYLQAIFPFERLITIFKNRFHIQKPEQLPGMLLEKEILEDYYWCKKIAVVFNDFRVAPPEVSFKFSFEVNPRSLFEMNHHQLPFGCHAWEKYEPDFWKQYIPEKPVIELKDA